jgi:glycosyltransferase involved in cell wall biosynthesis
LHDPELLPVLLGLRLLGRRVVFDFHEEFSAQLLGKRYLRKSLLPFATRMARFFEWLICKTSSAVIAATPKISASLPWVRATVVANYPSLSEFPETCGPPFVQRPPRAYYVGQVTRLRGCFEMVEAARIANQTTRVEFRIAGPFDHADATLKAELTKFAAGLPVEFPGRQNREQIRTELGLSRVGLALLHPAPNYLEALPVKIFEYMAAGLPVVASDFPLLREIVEDRGCGCVVDARDPRAAASKIIEIVSDPGRCEAMGAAGRAAIEEHFNWTTQWGALRRVYDALMSPPGGEKPACGAKTTSGRANVQAGEAQAQHIP